MAFSLIGALLDIEWLLQRDEGRPRSELASEDGTILEHAPRTPRAALQCWLAARRHELGHRTPGLRASELLTGLHVGAATLALFAGASTAGALLRGPSSREPTNVLTFIFATLVWPLALLAISLVGVCVRGRLGRSLLLQDLYVAGVGALERIARRLPEGEGWSVMRQWRALRRSERRYRDLELGTLLSAAQWYAIAFHAGAALTLTVSALFTDLAFGWSTTGDALEPRVLAGVARVVAAPWCDTLGVGCVSPELVAATQFSRFTGQYAAPQGALVSGAWWPVLLGSLVVYGVLPRLLFSLALGALVWRRSRGLAERVLELRGRVYGVTVGTSRNEPAAASSTPAPLAPVRDPARSASCWVLRWRGATLDESLLVEVCRRLGLNERRRDAAGDGDQEHDDGLLTPRSELEAVLLLVDGWEAPDKATRRFIEGLRKVRDWPVFVGVLLEAEAAPELAIWRDRLGLLQDPGVSVQPIATSTPSRAAEVRA
jgi:hypothetical protein